MAKPWPWHKPWPGHGHGVEKAVVCALQASLFILCGYLARCSVFAPTPAPAKRFFFWGGYLAQCSVFAPTPAPAKRAFFFYERPGSIRFQLVRFVSGRITFDYAELSKSERSAHPRITETSTL